MRSRLPGASGAADWRLDAERRGVATRINAGGPSDAAHAPGHAASAEPQWGVSAVGYGETRPDAAASAASAAEADAAAERMSDWQPVLEEEATVATAAPFDRFDVGAAPTAAPREGGAALSPEMYRTPSAAHAAFDDATSATRSATAAAATAAADAAAAPDAADAFVAGAVPGASRAAREGATAAAFADAAEAGREMKNAAFGGRDQAAEAEAFSAEGRADRRPRPV